MKYLGDDVDINVVWWRRIRKTSTKICQLSAISKDEEIFRSPPRNSIKGTLLRKIKGILLYIIWLVFLSGLNFVKGSIRQRYPIFFVIQSLKECLPCYFEKAVKMLISHGFLLSWLLPKIDTCQIGKVLFLRHG